jgi:hypothetical protein
MKAFAKALPKMSAKKRTITNTRFSAVAGGSKEAFGSHRFSISAPPVGFDETVT